MLNRDEFQLLFFFHLWHHGCLKLNPQQSYIVLCSILFYSKTSRLGRRKCQSTTRAPNNIVSVKSTMECCIFQDLMITDLLRSLLFEISTVLRTVFQIWPKYGSGEYSAGARFWLDLEKPPNFSQSWSRNPVQPYFKQTENMINCCNINVY